MSHHESPSRSNQIHSELTNVNQILPQHLPRSTEVYWSLLCCLCFVNTFMTRRTCCDFCDFSDVRATSACFLAALSSTESGVWKVVYDLHWATTGDTGSEFLLRAMQKPDWDLRSTSFEAPVQSHFSAENPTQLEWNKQKHHNFPQCRFEMVPNGSKWFEIRADYKDVISALNTMSYFNLQN